jgi:hypothetical protein
MKKNLLTILGITVFLAIAPLSALSLEQLNNEDMGAVTGQAGVTIDINDLDVDVTMGEMYWEDNEADNSGGRVVMSGVEQNITGEVHTKIDTMTNQAGESYIQLDLKDTELEVASMETTMQIADQAGNNAKSLGTLGLSGQKVTMNKCAVQIKAH